MSLANFSSMEEISLEDADKSSMEYRMLMVYVQRRLPASKYGQLLKREAKGEGGSSQIRLEAPEATPVEQGKAPQDLPPVDLKCSSKRKSQKKKRRSNLKRLFLPSCLQGQSGVDLRKSAAKWEQPLLCQCQAPPIEDPGITRVADKLAEIVDNSRFNAGGIEFRGLNRTVSLEEDGKMASKMVCQGPEDDGKDHEEKIIDTIVALLRKSGDDLEAQMQKDQTFCSSFWDLMSYSFFRRIANQFLKEIPVDPIRDSEDHVQSTRAAYVMEVTTRLTAVDNHPMNLVLGFGTKYLRENFKPWVCSHGGWEKALGLLDQDEVE